MSDQNYSNSNEPQLSQNLLENLKYNRERWGKKELWTQADAFGYNWSQMHEVPAYTSVTAIAEKYFLPVLEGNTNLNVLEIAPGAGRFTVELLRIAKELHLVDLNQACIDLCKERFSWYGNISYHVNDGISLTMIAENSLDLAVSYDSFVHIEPEIIRQYLLQIKDKLMPGGLIWLHHSANGENPSGHRTSMTDMQMKEFARELELEIQVIYYLGTKDCISVLRKPEK